MKIEYRLIPVTRYIVSRYESETHENGLESAGCSGFGEFDNESAAFAVAEALCAQEADKGARFLDAERKRKTDEHEAALSQVTE